MQPIRLYQTDPEGIWIPEAVVYSQVFGDGENLQHLYPAGTRTKQPPELQAHQAARTMGPELDADWEVVADYVGYRYWLADRSEHVITDVGVSPPEGHLTTDPGPTLKERATLELANTQSLVLACYEAGIAFPPEWRSYRTALRAIAAGTSSASGMPARPADPDGL